MTDSSDTHDTEASSAAPAQAEDVSAAVGSEVPAPPGPPGASQDGDKRSKPVRWPRRLLIGLSLLAAITAAAFTYGYYNYNDEALARTLSRVLSKEVKGRIEVRKVHWGARAIADMALGTASPVAIDGAAIFDSTGREIIYVEKIRAKIRLWSLLAHGEVRLSEVALRDGRVLVHSRAVGEERVIGIAEAFLPAKPSKKTEPDKPSNVPLLLFENISIEGIRFRLLIDETELVLPNVRTRARLRIQGDPSREGIHLDVKSLTADTGFYRQHMLKAALSKLRSRGARIDGQTLSAKLRCDLGGAPARIDGKLYSLFEKVALDIKASLSRTAILGRKLSKLDFSGRSGLALRVRGPAERLMIRADLRDVDLKLGPLTLRDASLSAGLDVAKGKVDLSKLALSTLGGQLRGTGEMALDKGTWRVETSLKGGELGGLVPALAGRLDGKVTLNGQLSPHPTGLAVVDVKLERKRRRRRDFLPRRLGVKGSLHVGTTVVDLAGLTVTADGNSARARGSINIPRKRANVFVALDLPRLGRWLRSRTGLAPARSARGKLHITGRWPRLVATGSVDARGVGIDNYRLPRLEGKLSFRNGTVSLERIVARGYGGSVRGKGKLQLFAGSLLSPLRKPLLSVRLTARDLALGKLTGGSSLAQGRISADIDIKGPVSAPKGVAELKARDLVIGGQRYRKALARVGLLADRISVYEAQLERHGGGRLRVWNDVFLDGRLALSAQLTRMPLAAVPGLDKVPVPITGRVSGKLALSGTITDPRAGGRLSLAQTTVRGARMGSGWLRIKPGSDTVRIEGALFNRLLKVDGYILMKPHHSLHVTVDIDRFPVHRIAPELAKVGDIRGVVSGRVGVDVDEKRGLRWVNARLSKVDFSLRYRPRGQRSYRVLKLRNDGDLVANYNGKRAQVVAAKLVSAVVGRANAPRATFAVKGALEPKASQLRLHGEVPLELAEFFLARRVKQVKGRVVADVSVSGPLAALVPQGSLKLSGVKVRLPRFDRALELPKGELRLTPKDLQVKQLTLKVGRSALHVRGKLGGAPAMLAGQFDGGSYQLDMAGDFNARLLRLIFPRVFSMATGSAAIGLSVRGPLTDPNLDGSVTLSKRNKLELKPRGLGRTIALSAGKVRLKRYHLATVQPLTGTYDEGTISLSGEARFDQRELVDIYVRFKGRNIPQRQPKVYAAEMNVDVTLVGDPKGRRLRCPLSKLQGETQYRALMVTGSVDVVDARYVREFDIVKNAVIKPRVYEEDKPFYAGNKLLSELGLCLTVRSTGQMKVKNRYANLGLETAIQVTGTLEKPRIGGNVRVEEGKFSIPFLRGDYKVERGEIAFSETKPPVKAELNIDAETEHVDRNGTVYQIRLNLKGPLDGIVIKLSSQPALEQGQILALLATGRTTDQLRNQLNSNQGQGGAAGAADAQVKALSGMVLSSILEDPIKKVTGLDLVRLEIGTETLTAKGCKRLGSFEICGEYEKDLLGGFSGKGSARYKLHDYLKLVGRLERLSTRFEREQENPSRARLELRFGFPLR
jgi:autotransporter translocation and assembly factor TamB